MTPRKGLGVEEKKILELFFKKIGVSMRNWVDSPQDMDSWKVFMNVALNFVT